MAGCVHRVVEREGSLFRLTAGGLEPISGLDALDGDTLLVTDFGGLAQSRVSRVEARARYAHLLLRRQLLESGEIDGAVEIFIHQSRRLGKGSELFFTWIPANAFQRYRQMVADFPHNLLLYPMTLLPAAQATGRRGGEAVVALLPYGRSIDYVVAARGRVLHSGQVVAFDENEASLEGAREMAGAALSQAQEEGGFSLAAAQLIPWMSRESEAPAGARRMAERLGAELAVAPLTGFGREGERWFSGVPRVMRRLRVRDVELVPRCGAQSRQLRQMPVRGRPDGDHQIARQIPERLRVGSPEKSIRGLRRCDKWRTFEQRGLYVFPV